MHEVVAIKVISGGDKVDQWWRLVVIAWCNRLELANGLVLCWVTETLLTACAHLQICREDIMIELVYRCMDAL